MNMSEVVQDGEPDPGINKRVKKHLKTRVCGVCRPNPAVKVDEMGKKTKRIKVKQNTQYKSQRERRNKTR